MAEFFGYCSAHPKDVACFIFLMIVSSYIIIKLVKKIWIWDRTLRDAQTPSTLAADFKNFWDLLCTRDYYVLVLILSSALAISAAIIRERFLRFLVVVVTANTLMSNSFELVISSQWKPRVIVASYGTSIILLCFGMCFTLFWKVIFAVGSVRGSGEGTRLVLALFGTGFIVACFWISIGLIKGFWRFVMKIGSWFSLSSIPK